MKNNNELKDEFNLDISLNKEVENLAPIVREDSLGDDYEDECDKYDAEASLKRVLEGKKYPAPIVREGSLGDDYEDECDKYDAEASLKRVLEGKKYPAPIVREDSPKDVTKTLKKKR